jgi:putative membrane protein
MAAPGVKRRTGLIMAATFAIAACERAETADVAGASLETAGLPIAATSDGDIEAAGESTTAGAALSDGNILGLLGMVDNSEIEAAKVARERGTSNRVKEFARMMETEHTDLLRKGRALATEISIEIEPPPARELEQMHIESMALLGREPRGDQFDRAYITGQITAHERILDLMRAAAAVEGREPRLRSYLQSAIAMVEQHRDRARGVLEGLGGPQDELSAR